MQDGVGIARISDQTWSTPFPAGASSTFEIEAESNANAVSTGGPTASVSSPAIDPASVAPAVTSPGGGSLIDGISFLYSGPNPLIVGVDAGALDPSRIAVVRGRVVDTSGSPIAGVLASFLGHDEYGRTATRADGMFDLVASGGGPLTIELRGAGHLPVQRTIVVPQGDFRTIDDVVLTPLDSAVTPVTFGASSAVARGNAVSDASGTRQATVYFPPGTTATLSFADGTTEPAPALHFRATEYTVGDAGPSAMPGTLPPTSDYTYAVEFSADEAQAAGASSVVFSQTVYGYVENFLGFPVGTGVPSGFYDRGAGNWVGSDNGLVIGILSVQGGVASLDVIGAGHPASSTQLSALGITSDELAILGATYSPGTSLWRVPLKHFTPLDWNFASRPIAGEETWSKDPKHNVTDDPCLAGGSIIECENQILGEEIPIAGTPYTLHYQSDRVPGRTAERSIIIPITGSSFSGALKGITLDVQVAGQHFTKDFAPGPNLSYTYTWDGKDAYGREVHGQWPATISVTFTYNAFYATPPQVVAAFAQQQHTTVSQVLARALRHDVGTRIVPLGAFDQRSLGLGGWSISPEHFYLPIGRALYAGDGTRHTADSLRGGVSLFAGDGTDATINSSGAATNTGIGQPVAMAIAPDHSVYVCDPNSELVLAIDPSHQVSVFAGTGARGTSGDEGPAVQATFSGITGLAVAQDGSLVIADTGAYRLRRIGTDGIINTIAGGQTPAGISNPEGVPALQATIVPYQVAIEPDGSILTYEELTGSLLRLSNDGLLHVLVSKIDLQTALGLPNAPSIQGFAVAPSGDIYVNVGGTRIAKLDRGGALTQVAGPAGSAGTTPGSSPDGSPALNNPIGAVEQLVTDDQGTVLFVDPSSRAVRSIDHDGLLRTVALGAGGGFNFQPYSLATGPGHTVLIGDGTAMQIFQLATSLPGLSADHIFIPSEDGALVYEFDQSGRHLTTIDALLGTTLLTLGYDGTGRLSTLTDANGNVTTVQHDAAGNPTQIVAPFGQVTTLSVDSNGFLSSIADPLGASVQLQSDAHGLLTQLTDPRGNVHQMSYDGDGRLLTDSDPAGGVTTLSRQESGSDFTVTRSTVRANPTTHAVTWTPLGRKEVSTGPDGLSATTQGTLYGSVQTTSPDGTVSNTWFGPDVRFGMNAPRVAAVSVSTPSGLTFNASSTQTFTPLNSLTPIGARSLVTSTTVNGVTWTSDYESDLGAVVDTSPTGRQVTKFVDAIGRVTEVDRAGFLPFRLQYDAVGRVQSISQGTRVTQLVYGDAGFLISATNAVGQTISLQRDAVGRITSATNAAGEQTQVSYDPSGNATGITPPGRPQHQFSYSPVDLMSSYAPPALDGGGAAVQYTYDEDRKLTQLNRADGSAVSFSYDDAGRLTSVTHALGTVSLAYDPDGGQVSRVTGPSETIGYSWDGSVLSSESWSGAFTAQLGRSYDTNFRLTGLTLNGSSLADYTYDDDGLLTQAGPLTLTSDPGNGLLTDTSAGVVTSHLAYTGYGELDTLDYSSGGTAVFHQDFVRDDLGRITTLNETHSDGSTDVYDYSYDDAGRLTDVKLNSAPEAHYDYDANGNRLSKTDSLGNATVGTYDARDRLLTYGTVQFGYTADGELASKTDTATGAVTTYQYDALGNLRNVGLPDGGSIDYLVDGLNRRIGKKLNGQVVQQFVYQDQLKPVAELDGAGNVVQEYVYATRVNVPDVIVTASAAYRVVTDHLGSVRELVDVASGAVVEVIRYDEFGNVLADSNQGMQPFGFAGGLADKETGFVRFVSRDYDCATGRWSIRDPALFGGGRSLYAYVSDNPINFVDISGRAGVAAPYPTSTIPGLEGLETIAEAIKIPSLDVIADAAATAVGAIVDVAVDAAVPVAAGAVVLFFPSSTASDDTFPNGPPGYQATHVPAATAPFCSKAGLPGLDSTGKVHGALPSRTELDGYASDELEQFKSDLEQSVQERIRRTTELGPDKPHGERQAAEQQLIQDIVKILEGRR